MFKSILESFRYVGLMFPVAFLRIYVGYKFLVSGLDKLNSEYLVHPLMAAKITEWLPYSSAPDWYKNWLEVDIIPNDNWKILAFIVTYLEIAVGISFIIGLLIRPMAILGMLLMFHYILAQGLGLVPYYQLQIFIFFILFWLGAGRCVGLDYYFYKRQRGYLW